MPANVQTMFSVRQVPWHGMGIIVDEAPSSQEAIKLAGLDWTVEQRDVYVGEKKLEGTVANVRTDNDTVLGLVSPQYKIVQNWEAFSFTDKLLGEGVKYETAGALAEGKKVWLLARLPKTVLVGDETIPYLVFTNSHDGQGSVRVAITPVRVVCQNTLNIALQGASRSWSTIHTGQINDKLAEAQHTLELATNYMERLASESWRLASIRLSKNDVTDIIQELYPMPEPEKRTEKKVKTIEELRSQLFLRYNNAPDLKKFRGTGWGLVNAVSDFVTHREPMRKTATYRERLFERTIGGHPKIDDAVKFVKKVA